MCLCQLTATFQHTFYWAFMPLLRDSGFHHPYVRKNRCTCLNRFYTCLNWPMAKPHQILELRVTCGHNTPLPYAVFWRIITNNFACDSSTGLVYCFCFFCAGTAIDTVCYYALFIICLLYT